MRKPLSYDGKYVWIWEKYRPVILKLMIDSSSSTQEYQFSSHEFKDSNNKRDTGYAFKLTVHQGRSQNDIKKSLIAQDLLHVLRCSTTGEDLMQKATYQFDFDKHFKLCVTQTSEAVTSDEEEQTS